MATHRPLAGRKLSRRTRTLFKRQADAFAPDTYVAYHKGTEEQPLLVGGIQVLDKNDQPVTRTVPVVRPAEHRVNHFRRLKRAWAKYGIEGFNRYMTRQGAPSLLPQA